MRFSHIRRWTPTKVALIRSHHNGSVPSGMYVGAGVSTRLVTGPLVAGAIVMGGLVTGPSVGRAVEGAIVTGATVTTMGAPVVGALVAGAPVRAIGATVAGLAVVVATGLLVASDGHGSMSHLQIWSPAAPSQ